MLISYFFTHRIIILYNKNGIDRQGNQTTQPVQMYRLARAFSA